MQSGTVGGTGVSSSLTPKIDGAEWSAWLGQLSPAALRAVLAQAIVLGPPAAIPADYSEQAFALGPQVAALVAAEEAAMRAQPTPPLLVQTPDGRRFYSAAGTSYRRVPPGETAATLELNPSAVVPVAALALPESGVWPTGATPSSVFAEVGRLVAASGDVTAAYRFAGAWRRLVAPAS